MPPWTQHLKFPEQFRKAFMFYFRFQNIIFCPICTFDLVSIQGVPKKQKLLKSPITI